MLHCRRALPYLVAAIGAAGILSYAALRPEGAPTRSVPVVGIDRARIHGWGLSQAVLSAWGSFEDHGRGWEPAIACAALLAAITP